MIGFIAPYTFAQFRIAGNYSAIAILHTLQFTVTHALGSTGFTSRLLATDLTQSHWHFESHVESSCHRGIPFLPLFCDCDFLRLGSTTLDCCSLLLLLLCLYSPSDFLWPFITPRHGPHGKHSLQLLRMRVYNSVASNRRPSFPRVSFCGNVFT
jgi:hypothetical protein